MYKTALVLGIIFSALGVILGAFGAHGLKPLLDADQLQVYETGVRYQMYHAFAMIAAGILYGQFPGNAIKGATLFFLFGIFLFSGSLYTMTALKISGQVGLGGLGIITPFGGLCFIAGWILLLGGILKKR